MVCKEIDTCQLKMNLNDFTNICAVTDVDKPGCPDVFTHRKTPDGWRHYFRITHHSLKSLKRDEP